MTVRIFRNILPLQKQHEMDKHMLNIKKDLVTKFYAYLYHTHAHIHAHIHIHTHICVPASYFAYEYLLRYLQPYAGQIPLLVDV